MRCGREPSRGPEGALPRHGPLRRSWPGGPPVASTAPTGSGPLSDAPHDAASGFGPSGYLPDRAARRARKIVLRAPLGLQWVVASLVAGLVLLVAGALLLGRGADAPGAPWVPLGPVASLAPSATDAGTGLLVVHVAGRVRAFEAPDGVAYCAASNRLEHPDGRVWALTGRGLAGTASLVPVPTLTVAGVAHVDPTAAGEPLDPVDDPAGPGC